MTAATPQPVHPRITTNGIALADMPVEAQLRWAASAGVVGHGLPIDCVDRDGVDAVAAARASTGVAVPYLIVPALFTLAAPEAWAAERARAVRAVEAAAAVGAPTVYVTTGPAGRLAFEEAARAFAEAVGPVGERARTLGVRLLVEPTNVLRDDLGFVCALDDAVAVAEEAGVGACADLLWCWRERGLRETVRRAASLIGLVQVSDCALGTTAMPCRLVPGDGVVELERPLRWLLEAGYAGPIDLELVGPQITEEGPRRALERGVAHVSALLTRLGA